MRKYLKGFLRVVITPEEQLRIANIRMPVKMTYEQVLGQLEQEVREVGLKTVENRLKNEAVVLEELREVQEDLDKKAEKIVLERIVNRQAEGYEVDAAIEFAANRLADEGLDTRSRLPLDEQASGLNVRKLLFDRNYTKLSALKASVSPLDLNAAEPPHKSLFQGKS